MNTQYKDIRFEYQARGSREDVKNWCCISNKDGWELGFILFYPQWKQHVFVTSSKTALFSSSCLIDIANFLDQLAGKK